MVIIDSLQEFAKTLSNGTIADPPPTTYNLATAQNVTDDRQIIDGWHIVA